MKSPPAKRASQARNWPQPGRRNVSLVAGILALNAAIYFVLPRLHLPTAVAWATIAAAALTTPFFWALIHEAIHTGLWPERRVNHLLGRLLGIAFGTPLVVLRAGHLLHHRRNRGALDRTEVYDPAEKSWWRHAAVYYPRLLGGLYLAEVASGPLGWLPKPLLGKLIGRQFQGGGQAGLQECALIKNELLGWSALRAWRSDALLTLLLFGTAFLAYGSSAAMLVVYLLLRGLLISLLDNSYHYATPLGESQLALNLRLPWPLRSAMLNFNLHGVHHAHVRASCHELAGLFQAESWEYQGSLLWQVLRQLRGPIAASALPRGAIR